MAWQASAVILRARLLLQDSRTMKRWDDAALLVWLNDSLRMAIQAMPAIHSKIEAVPLQAGVRQSLPDDCLAPVAVRQNTAGSIITEADFALLDIEDFGWRNAAGSKTVIHYEFPAGALDYFNVYPAQPTGTDAQVDLEYGYAPAELVDTTDTMPVNQVYAVPLAHAVAYKAFEQDSNNPHNQGQATHHLEQFRNLLAMNIIGGQR